MAPRCRAVDSATLMTDLDALATPEWQSLPEEGNAEKEALLTAQAQSAVSGAAAYAVAQQALWHNCPDALELALRVVGQEVELMDQKLQFTRIRQHFVEICQAFHTGGASSSIDAFCTRAAEVERECVALMERQLCEQKNRLPGLVTRRDTILLHRRMQDIVKRITSTALSSRRAVPSSRRRKQVDNGMQADKDLREKRRDVGSAQPIDEATQQCAAKVSPHNGRRHDADQVRLGGQRALPVPGVIVAPETASCQEIPLNIPIGLAQVCTFDEELGIERDEELDSALLQVDISRYQGFSRSELIDALFQVLDTDGDHRLRWHELKSFVSWLWHSERPLNSEAYLHICQEFSVHPKHGLDRRCFAAIVDERVESGCHCTNIELAGVLTMATHNAIVEHDGSHGKDGGA